MFEAVPERILFRQELCVLLLEVCQILNVCFDPCRYHFWLLVLLFHHSQLIDGLSNLFFDELFVGTEGLDDALHDAL